MASDNILEYKGYHTRVEYDAEAGILIGKIEGIRDFVNFECENLNDVVKEFHDAVDDYLDFCKEIGKEPEKEYKGTFNVRIKPELHKELALEAFKEGKTLNSVVEKAIEQYINGCNNEDKNSKIPLTFKIYFPVNESTYTYKNSELLGKNFWDYNKYSRFNTKYNEEVSLL